MALFDFIAIKSMGITVLYSGMLKILPVLLGYALLSYAFHRLSIVKNGGEASILERVYKSMGCFFETLGQFILFIIFATILSYIASASPRPFYDEQLLAIDKWIGLDILSYAAWVNKHQYVNLIMEKSYNSFFQIPCLFMALSILQRYVALYSVMLCFLLSLVICVAIAAIFPAVSVITFLNIDANIFPNVNMISGYWHIHDLLEMKNGINKTINLFTLKGIITFPSFHASIAVILSWGFWQIKYLRLPFLLLNALMIFSVPITGGHYFIDAISGIMLAIIMILIIKYCVKFIELNIGERK